ncbi:MAG: hypothetical protein RMJ44_04415 [Cytophagales bacterium]|nr:hypothetical protein [Bernardetiaceae bacterium]MDW8210308.1 hypothetical protein [Cytophagales bacterium]
MKPLAAILFTLGCSLVHGQTNTLRFRITHIKELTDCQSKKGICFEQGNIFAENRTKDVEVALYLERSSGIFHMIRRRYPAGLLNVPLNISDCDYTGNHYAYIKYVDDTDYQFPSVEEVARWHKETIQTRKPEFVITLIKPNPQCLHSYRIESGFVYSPAGGRVDIKLLLETTTGQWRTLTLHRYGTGPVPIHYAACDLTGNYKAIANYGYPLTSDLTSNDKP